MNIALNMCDARVTLREKVWLWCILLLAFPFASAIIAALWAEPRIRMGNPVVRQHGLIAWIEVVDASGPSETSVTIFPIGLIVAVVGTVVVLLTTLVGAKRCARAIDGLERCEYCSYRLDFAGTACPECGNQVAESSAYAWKQVFRPLYRHLVIGLVCLMTIPGIVLWLMSIVLIYVVLGAYHLATSPVITMYSVGLFMMLGSLTIGATALVRFGRLIQSD